MGHFIVKEKNKLEDLEIGHKIPESDFSTLTPSGVFVQLEHVDDETVKQDYDVKPGIWAVNVVNRQLVLSTTSFVSDKILDTFVNTKNITDKIDCFFRNLHVYKELGFEVAKRAALLYGPPGSGKSTAISLVANRYVADGKTAVVIWHTDKFEPFQIKDFIQSFNYCGVDKLILIAEDIGGIEIENARMKSDSSLLSLLDNQEKTFTIPVFILATTNYPENFMGNLTNRPNRFDDKIEVGNPTAEQRQRLLDFFSKTTVTEGAKELLGSSACSGFSPAHIREIVVRSMIYEKTQEQVIKEMQNEIKVYTKSFMEEKRMGFEV